MSWCGVQQAGVWRWWVYLHWLTSITDSRDQLQAMLLSPGVNEVRCKTAAWNNIEQARMSERARTHRKRCGGLATRRRVLSHVKYARRPQTCGQTARNTRHLRVVSLVKWYNMKLRPIKCALINWQSLCYNPTELMIKSKMNKLMLQFNWNLAQR